MGRRRYPRTEISYSAAFLFRGGSYSGCHIQNFSIGGLFISWGESGLAELIEPGFHQPKQREQAVVELEGGRVTATVEIVYVSQTGLGVAFVGSEETLYTYLQDYTKSVVEKSDAPHQRMPKSTTATQSIIDRLRDKTVDFLNKQFSRFPVLATEELIAATDHSTGDAEQGDLFFAVATLEGEETKISSSFLTGVEAEFAALMGKDSRTEVNPRDDAERSELELVEKEEFDEWIHLDGIAHRVESQLTTQVYQLNYALSHLFQRPIKNESNPLSPIALLLEMQRALEAYPFIPEAKKLIYQAFSKSIFPNIHRLYDEIIICLNEEGIETGSPEHPVRPHNFTPNHVVNREHPSATNLENLSVLLDAAKGGPAVAPQEVSDYPLASQEQVIQSMEALPLRRSGSVLTQLENYLTHRVNEPVALDQAARVVIGASEELVTAVQQDDLLGNSVQQLVNQLEIPFIRESLNDPTILENSQHPGRRFLQVVGDLAPYCNTSFGRDSSDLDYNPQLQQLVNNIESGALTNIAEVTERVEVLHDQQKEQFERNRNLAIESCNRRDRLRQTHSLVKKSLQEMLLGESVSIALDRLFHYGWANLLMHTAMLHGHGGVVWRAYLRVVDLLLKLFQKERPFTHLSDKIIKDILKLISKGFTDYPVHPEGTQQFAAELKRALVEGGEPAQEFITNRVNVDQAYLDRLFLGQKIESETSQGQPVDQVWIERVEGLSVGEWIVQRHSNEGHRLVNLAWKGLEIDKYLLVDGSGLKALEGDANKLAGLFKENQLSLLENREVQVVDRAVQRILKHTYDSVQHEVSTDELTGLINRRAFERLLNELFKSEAGEQDQHTIILLDVDQFGLVNDLCGFEGGDKLLQSISNILRNYLPDNAHLARTGDDEFTILVPQSSLDLGYQIAEEQRQAIDTFKFSWDNQVISVSASVGVVSVVDREHSSAELMKTAASACSIAKQAGRNCTRIYRATDKEFMERSQLIKSVAVIEDALENNKIVLVAQPIVPLQEGQGSSHYEILLRVLDENGEHQSPVHFILAAERYNFMRSVDRWVVDTFFETVNRQFEELQEIGGFSINLSSQSMVDQEFKAYLKQHIERSPIPREKLGFEITETAMLKDSQDAISFIKEIKETGCSFYLDDFGSGYASFSYLKEMPVDYVKIDGIFIRDLLQDKASQEMVKAITGISHFMHKQVVAEFVENQEIADELKKIGVDYIQGYHVGRPVPLSQIIPADEYVNAC